MLMNQFKSIFFKEYCLLKNRLKSYCISVLLGYIIVLFIVFFSKSMGNNSSSFIVLYSTIYMGFLSYVYLMRFWEEKITGTMEYTFSLGFSIKRIIILKVLSYSIFGLIFMIFFFISSSIIFFNFNLFHLFASIIIYLLFVIPYGFINGCGMWCLNSGIAKLIQLLSMGLIITFIGSVVLTIANANIIKFYLPTIIFISAIFWLIGIILFIKSDKEKAILSTIE